VRRVLAASLLAGLLVAMEDAGAAVINGTAARDHLRGTPGSDSLYGLGGNDRLDARAGADFIKGGPGRDFVLAGAGNDRIAVQADEGRDTVRCGPGRDIVNAEREDSVGADCEVVSRQLSPPRGARAGHFEPQVEPDSFSSGRTVVTAFQAWRFADGGAANIGFATSRDAGRTWRSGFLPGTTVYSTPGGTLDFVTDPVVAYDAAHRTWLVATLGATGRFSSLQVSRSRNGLAWGSPVRVVGNSVEDLDKEWLACDNSPGSRFRGRCYLSYLNLSTRELLTSRSTDGGATWSTPVLTYARLPEWAVPQGVFPVVRPDGALVLTFVVFTALPSGNHVAAVRSSDGGVSFGPAVVVAPLDEAQVTGMRAGPLPSADVDAGGRVYAVWSDCKFSELCAGDVVVARSPDGVSWTSPERVPIGVPSDGVHRFVPGIAVEPGTGGARARVAIAYHAMKQTEGCDPVLSCPGVDVWMIQSDDGGTTWRAPQRLSAESMPLLWMPETNVGRMLGDYISASWTGGRAVPVFALASEPAGVRLRQAIFAATRVR
jgi:RTX calcium-binding nonapeptide repeat (4 copies)